PQPAAKGVPVAVAAEAVEVAGDGVEHVLEYIGRVGGRQAPAAAPVQDERGVQGDHALPGPRVVVPGPGEQAARRRRGRRPASLAGSGLTVAHGGSIAVPSWDAAESEVDR